MLLAYLDESYDDASYWIAGLLCPEHAIKSLSHALDQVVHRAIVGHGVPLETELHGYDLCHGSEPWQNLGPDTRINIYGEALDAIAGHDVEFHLKGTRKQGLKYSSDPHDITLRYLLEPLDTAADYYGQTLLVIADETNDNDTYRADLRWYQQFNTGGYKPRQLRHIVDTLHFAPSHASRLLQAVDLALFIWRRKHFSRATDQREIEANDRLWSRVDSQLRHHGCWDPQ